MAADTGPNERLNADPSDTNNPRLVGKQFPYNNLPFKADTSNGERGVQSGYNRCNATTEGPNSLCQTIVLNSIDDFCLWGPPEMATVGDAEAESVAWCTKPGRGGRLIPPGALTGVQFIRTPSYVEITGLINQALINIPSNDEGGELDSGGQDLRGNPIGALAYSTSMGSSHGYPTQSRTWHSFMGSNVFCMKLCDPKAPNAAGLCRHTLDTLGCEVNVPASYRDGVFESCLGDDQKQVEAGVSDIPASSQCTPYQSAQIYTATYGGAPAGQTPAPAPPAQTPAPGGQAPAPGGQAPPAGQNPPASNTPTRSGSAIPPTHTGSPSPSSDSANLPAGGAGGDNQSGTTEEDPDSGAVALGISSFAMLASFVVLSLGAVVA
ncbi:hypothetical protein AURDEDRAFT_112801 [Auricularia subglabra TFB-10046 SS5]|nr:hypothetical protein AURDEDRAFT_112801 [Auricularia subglabra TFB-10046 SS5]